MINIQNFQTEKELSIVQFSTNQKDTFDYISVSTALKNKYIEIKELDEDGDVNNLIVTNKSRQYVFIMDGDILEGAKQNRVLNTSVLLAPASKTILPVSCVEQGRWSSISEKFYDADYVAPFEIRKQKAISVKESLYAGENFMADQSEVWENVQGFSNLHHSYSPTSNLSDIYNEKKDTFDKFIKLFDPKKECNGIAIFVRKNLITIDIFNKGEVYTEYFPKLLKGVALEAYHLKKSDNTISQEEASNVIVNFFNKFDSIEKKEFDGVGVGIEERFETKEFTGFSLNYKSNLIHSAVLFI